MNTEALRTCKALLDILKKWTAKYDKAPHIARFYRDELPMCAGIAGLDLMELVDAARTVAELDIELPTAAHSPKAVASLLLEQLTPCGNPLSTVDEDLRRIRERLEFGTIYDLWQAPDASKTAPRANTSVIFHGEQPTTDVRDLCFLLAKRGEKSENEIAREFTRGNDRKAKSLLSSVRRLRRKKRVEFV